MILGRGSFTESFPLFGYSLDDYDILFEEKLALFAALRDADRTGEAVRWNGTCARRSTACASSAGRAAAAQDLGGRRWQPGVGGARGRYGLPLTLAIIGGDPRRFAPYVELYHQALGQLGFGPLPVAVHSPGHVAATDAEAREQLWPAYEVMRNRIGAERGWGADEPGRVRP